MDISTEDKRIIKEALTNYLDDLGVDSLCNGEDDFCTYDVEGCAIPYKEEIANVNKLIDRMS